MNLREALQILGPERVSRGMRAFAEPTFEGWENCFLAHVYGKRCELQDLISTAGSVMEAEAVAAAALNIPLVALEVITKDFDAATNAPMHAECVAYLAENGTAVEPAVASCGIPVLVQGVTETL